MIEFEFVLSVCAPQERLKLGGCSRCWERAGPMQSSAHGGRRHAARLQLQRGEQRQMARPVRAGTAKGTDPVRSLSFALSTMFILNLWLNE